jgi:hypothetical protein
MKYQTLKYFNVLNYNRVILTNRFTSLFVYYFNCFKVIKNNLLTVGLEPTSLSAPKFKFGEFTNFSK